MRNNKKKKNSPNEQKRKVEKVLTDSSLRVPAILLPLFMLVVLGIVMLSYESTLLFKVQEYNLFLYTPLFFKQCMVSSGGLLTWLGTYFTQYFYHQWIGVLFLCLWWALLMWLTRKAFNIPNKWIVAVLVPVALLAIADFMIGYWLFYLKMRGYYFASTIGMCVVMALVWLIVAYLINISSTPYLLL